MRTDSGCSSSPLATRGPPLAVQHQHVEASVVQSPGRGQPAGAAPHTTTSGLTGRLRPRLNPGGGEGPQREALGDRAVGVVHEVADVDADPPGGPGTVRPLGVEQPL